MKFDPKFIVKVAGTLTVISLVTAAVLGGVNAVTKDPIAAINAQKTQDAMAAVVSDPTAFQAVESIPQEAVDAAASYGGTLTELYDGQGTGYVMKVVASGSQGSIEMMVGVDAEGAVTGVSVVDHAETSGIGTKVTGNEPLPSGTGVLDQFKGMSHADGDLVVGKNVDAISGATVSSRGITTGVNAALAAAEALA